MFLVYLAACRQSKAPDGLAIQNKISEKNYEPTFPN